MRRRSAASASQAPRQRFLFHKKLLAPCSHSRGDAIGRRAARPRLTDGCELIDDRRPAFFVTGSRFDTGELLVGEHEFGFAVAFVRKVEAIGEGSCSSAGSSSSQRHIMTRRFGAFTSRYVPRATNRSFSGESIAMLKVPAIASPPMWMSVVRLPVVKNRRQFQGFGPGGPAGVRAEQASSGWRTRSQPPP